MLHPYVGSLVTCWSLRAAALKIPKVIKQLFPNFGCALESLGVGYLSTTITDYNAVGLAGPWNLYILKACVFTKFLQQCTEMRTRVVQAFTNICSGSLQGEEVSFRVTWGVCYKLKHWAYQVQRGRSCDDDFNGSYQYLNNL